MILGVPSAVSRTLAGFRSRWMIPASWATCTAWARVTSAGGLAGRLRRSGQRLGEAAAIEQFEREERPAVLLADVVDLDDVRMPQAGDRLGLGRKRAARAAPA